jgi:hypothetical protein
VASLPRTYLVAGKHCYCKKSAPVSPTAGRLATETFGYDGGRPVTAYVPQVPPEVIVCVIVPAYDRQIN